MAVGEGPGLSVGDLTQPPTRGPRGERVLLAAEALVPRTLTCPGRRVRPTLPSFLGAQGGHSSVAGQERV